MEENPASEAQALHGGAPLVINEPFTPLFGFESSFWSYPRSALCRLSIHVPPSVRLYIIILLPSLVQLVVRLPLRLTSLLNSLTHLHMEEPISKRLEWDGPPEDQAVSGSVVEFAFGLDENSYLATSYPHRPHLADKRDVRTIAVSEPSWSGAVIPLTTC